MKVIYRNSVLDRINAALIEAAYENKKIDQIQLTQEEWDELWSGSSKTPAFTYVQDALVKPV